MKTIHANHFEGSATVGAAYGHAQPRPVIRRKTLAQAVSAALLVMGSGVVMAEDCPEPVGDLITVPDGMTVTAQCELGKNESLIVKGGGEIDFSTGQGVVRVAGSFSNPKEAGFIDIEEDGLVSNGNGAGIVILDGKLTEGLINSGHIDAGGNGIELTSGAIEGGITNGGTIEGGFDGIEVRASGLEGGITNEGGTISGGSTAGIRLDSASQLTGGITNSGSIQGEQHGIFLDRASGVAGGIINNGSIQGQEDDEGAGIFLDRASSVAGGITNNGSIQGVFAGIDVVRSSSISGGITNTDMISGEDVGIIFDEDSELDGGITNTGEISGGGGGIIFVDNSDSTLNGDITNTGTISGGSTGIGFFLTSDLDGGITNSGTISGGDHSIIVDATSTLDFITIAGNNTAKFIGDVQAPDTPVTVASDAVYTIEDDITFDVGSFTVDGEMGVDAGKSATITGDFTLSAAGTFRTHVSGNPNYGQLFVAEGPNGSGGSTATLEDGSTIDLQFSDPSTCNSLEVGSVLEDVITADNLTVSGDLNVTSNCESLVFEAQSQNGSVSVEAVGSAGPPAQPPQPVPVNGPWGLVLLALSVLGFGAWRRRAQLKT